MNSCEYYLELVSQSLDTPLPESQHKALQDHLNQCPDCRLLAQQLTRIHEELSSWEDLPAPAALTSGVMEQVRAMDTPKNIIPLWKRPQFKAFGSIAACALLCLGLWRSGMFSGDNAMSGAAQITADTTHSESAAQPAPAMFASAPESAQAAPAAEAPAAEAPAAPAAAAGNASNYEFDLMLRTSLPDEKMSVSAEDTLPDDTLLLTMARQATGVEVGTLLVLEVLPRPLDDCGCWYTGENGLTFFLFSALPEQALLQELQDAAHHSICSAQEPLALLLCGQ